MEKEGLLGKRLFRSRVKSANVNIFEVFFGYFAGPVCALLASGIFTSFLNKYYTNYLFVELLADPAVGAAVNAFLVLLPLLSAILIVLGNLVAGQLIERTKSIAGKARPWILLSSATLTVTSLLIFAIPLIIDPNVSAVATMIITAIAYNLYYSVAYPLYNTANSTLVAVSTRNSNQRGLLASVTNLSATACVGLGSMIFPILLGLLISDTTPASEARMSWFIIFLVIGIVTFAVTILQYYFTRERITEENFLIPPEARTKEKKRSIGEQFKACASDKFWWIVVVFCFLFQLAGGIKNVTLTYYADIMDSSFWGSDPSLASGLTMSLFSIVGAIPMAAAVAVAWPLSLKIGKKNVVIGGLAIAIIGDVIAFIGGSNVVVAAVGVFLKNLGCAPGVYMLLAMFTDDLDHGEAKNGFRCDGLTMSIYSSIMVAQTPLGTALFNALTGSGTNQTMVSFCYLWVEAICFGAGIIMLLFYTIEKTIKADQETIKERKKAEVLAAGGEWVEPEERARREKEEEDRLAEEARIKELREKCERKGLDFETEEAKYQERKAKKKK